MREINQSAQWMRENNWAVAEQTKAASPIAQRHKKALESSAEATPGSRGLKVDPEGHQVGSI